MFSQGKTPFSAAPNLLTPRLSIQLMSARPALEFRKAHCPILIVAAREDDIMPLKIAREVALSASESQCRSCGMLC